MWDQIDYGTVIFHSDYLFNDGDRSPKLLVVLGWSADYASFILTTSRPPPNDVNYGCHAGLSLFKAQSLQSNCLDKDTYMLLPRFGNLKPEIANHAGWLAKAKIIGKLPEQTTNEIKNCALLSRDVNDRRKQRLGLRRPTPPKVLTP